MNILMVTPRFGDTSGGDGLYVHVLSTLLTEMGVKASVLTVRDEKFVYQEVGRSAEGTVPSATAAWQVLGRAYTDVLRANYYSPDAGSAVAEAIRRSRPTVIHLHGIHQYFTISAVHAIRAAHVPIVATLHDYKYFCGNSGFFSDRTRQVCLKCLDGSILPPIGERCKKDSWVASAGTSVQMGIWKLLGQGAAPAAFHCPSQFVHDLLSKNKTLEGRLVLNRYPLMDRQVDPVSDVPLPARIVYFGRMVRHKGASVFARGVVDLDAEIHVFGNGPEFEEVRAILANHRRTQLHGWTSRAELQKYIGPGTVVVLPYLAPETFCFAVAESMVRGACVVASARGAIPELINDGQNGMLLRESTAEEVGRVVQHLLENPSEVFRMGQEAAYIVGSLPTQTSHAEAMLRLYGSLVGGKA